MGVILDNCSLTLDDVKAFLHLDADITGDDATLTRFLYASIAKAEMLSNGYPFTFGGSTVTIPDDVDEWILSRVARVWRMGGQGVLRDMVAGLNDVQWRQSEDEWPSRYRVSPGL